MCIHCSCSNNFLNFGSLYFQSGALGDPDNLLPLDKIPTNEFIEKFLEDDSSESGKKDSSSTNMKRAESKPKIKVDPLPDISDDDLETVLDIEGKKPSVVIFQAIPLSLDTIKATTSGPHQFSLHC